MAAIELRPMSIGDILDTTFRLYRSRFTTFLIIVFVAYVPYGIVMAAFQSSLGVQQQNPFAPPGVGAGGAQSRVASGSSPVFFGQAGPVGGQFDPDSPMSPPSPAALFGPMIGIFLFALVVLPLCQAALLQNVSSAYLGEELGAAASYGRAAPRLFRMIVASFIGGIVIMFGFCLLVVPGIIFSLWFALVGPAIMLENRTVFAALGRSRELMRGNLGKGFGLFLVVGIMTLIVSQVLVFGTAMIPWPHPFLAGFFTNVVPAVLVPIQVAPGILLYYDIRIRKEAFDLQMLAGDLGRPVAT